MNISVGFISEPGTASSFNHTNVTVSTNVTSAPVTQNGTDETFAINMAENVDSLINIVVMSSTVIPCLCTGVALWMICLCKNLPAHLKYPSVSFLISNLLNFLVVLLFRLLIYGFNLRYDILSSSQIIFSGMFFSISGFAVTLMSVDRLLAVWTPFFHKLYMTQKIVKLIIYIGWLLIITVMSTAWTFAQVDQALSDKGDDTVYISRRMNVTTILIFPILTIVSTSALLYRLNTNKNLTFQRKVYRVTRILVMIIITHTVLTMPYVSHFILLELRPDLKYMPLRKFLHLIVYICLIVNCTVEAFIYTLNIKECKNNALRIFCGRKPPAAEMHSGGGKQSRESSSDERKQCQVVV